MQWSMRTTRGMKGNGDAPVTASVIVVLVVVVFAMGVSGGFLLTRSRIPDAVVSSTSPGVLAATSGEYTDPRSISVTMVTGAGRAIVSSVGGVVTSTKCEPGAKLESGSGLVSVNGVPVLALYSAVPPYRDLKPGDGGDDAAALNAELRRLGKDVPDGNIVTQSTVNAFDEVSEAVGIRIPVRGSGRIVAATAVAWMDRPSATIESCPATLGSTVALGDPLIMTAGIPQPAAVSIAEQPELEGARSLEIDGKRYPLAADVSQIADQTILDAIRASGAYRQALAMAGAGMGGTTEAAPVGSSLTVTLKWSLDAPIVVWSVPPSSLYDVDRSRACLVSDGKPTVVRIVASELGKTMVNVESGVPIGAVEVRPHGDGPCR